MGLTFRSIQKGCSERYRFSRGFRRRSLKKGADRGTDSDTEADSYFNRKPAVRGDHNVRTLYGEGTTRDLLRAV